ncbi:MAG TPA: tetratricopeptide repeat protein [Vicinamibacterales bacterium]
MTTPIAPRKVETLTPKNRLESWKEIAAYLSRSERTVRRWEEKEGLPVHRLAHDKRGSVYAFTGELDDWRSSRRQLMESDPGETPASVGRVLWTRRRHGGWGAGAVAAMVFVASAIWFLRPSERVRRIPNPEAVRLEQLANFGANAGRTQIETGIGYYQDAIRVDPDYAPAWIGLASAHLVRIWFGEVKATEAAAQARREAEQALRLDPTLGAAWRVLAGISHFVEWNHDQAEMQFRKAFELSPTGAVTLSWYGDFMADMRRFEEARAYYRKAQEASPRWLEPIAFTANTHFFSGNPDLAIVEYTRVLESEPNYGLGLYFLGRALVAKGEYEEGIARLRQANDVLGRVGFALGDLGSGLAKAGKRAEAEAMRDDLIQRRTSGYFPAFPIAIVELGLGNTEAAMDWLERAADEQNIGFYLPSADPDYDAVRSHPRFRAVMKRAHLDRVGP